MQQWHFDIQHELLHNTVVTVSYVGSKGTHLGRQTDLNQLHPTPLASNPYKPGEAISTETTTLSNGNVGSVDCGFQVDPDTGVPTNAATPGGQPITGQAAVNLAVAACGGIADLFRPFLGLGTITRLEPAASSTYHALQISARRSIGGLTLNAAYIATPSTMPPIAMTARSSTPTTRMAIARVRVSMPAIC
jgi:hypothetical protein